LGGKREKLLVWGQGKKEKRGKLVYPTDGGTLKSYSGSNLAEI
jgi:hypothetical protein